MPLEIPDNRAAMKILVLRLSSMGDVILASPLFTFLRERRPGSFVTFVTDNAYAPLFGDDTRLSAAVGIGQSDAALPASITAQEWDQVIDLQNNGRSRALLGQVRTKSGPRVFDKQHAERFLLLVFRMDFYDPSRHAAARYIETAGGDPHKEGIPAPALRLKEESCRRVRRERFGPDTRPCLALFPFSAWKNKEWPADRFECVGRHFIDKGWNAAIIGGPRDAPAAEAMCSRIGGRCVSLAGALTLYECGCLLKSFSLALGNDTGLSHLARACGVKTGVIYGPTTRQLGFYPFGKPLFKIFEERLFCRPCHAHGGNVCVRLSRPCMKKIDAAHVICGLEELAGAP